MRLMGAREGFVKIPLWRRLLLWERQVVIPLILLMWLYRWGLAFAVSGLNGLGSLRGLESGPSHRGPGISRTYPCVRTLGILQGLREDCLLWGSEAQEERALMYAVS